MSFLNIIVFILIIQIYFCEELSLNLTINYGVYGTNIKFFNINTQELNEQYVLLNLQEYITILCLNPLGGLEPYDSYMIEDDDFTPIKILNFKVGLYLDNDKSININIDGSDSSIIKNFETGIALSFPKNDLNYSITHQLYNNKQIDHLSFTLFPGYSQNKILKQTGKIYFGKPPSNLIKNKLFSRCKISDIDYWTCKGNEILIMGHSSNPLSFPINANISFDTHNGFTYVPKEFIFYLKDTVFKEMYEKQLCWDGKHLSQNGIVCSFKINMEIFKGIKLSLVIDGFHFESEIQEMFVQYGENFIFEFVYYYSWLVNYNWNFGGLFLQRYITTFDYEEKMITFYSLNKNNETSYITILINLSIVILGFGSFLLIGLNNLILRKQ